jgi:hypothetical protein
VLVVVVEVEPPDAVLLAVESAAIGARDCAISTAGRKEAAEAADGEKQNIDTSATKPATRNAFSTGPISFPSQISLR